jgi:hypothetical protein
MHVHCPDTCCMTKAVLRVHVHAACTCPCCMSMSILHVHVYTACPCPCCMSRSMLHAHVNVHVHIYRKAGMPDRPASSQSGTGLKQLTIPEQVRYRTKLTQSGIFVVRYRTKIRDAGMPMPALVFSMPMPSSGKYQLLVAWNYSAVSHFCFVNNVCS